MAADLKYFVVHSALLRLIDPVRGPPTRTSLDETPDGGILGGLQLKQKFLDSFALICSTSRSGAETASAVCLEQHNPAGAILRVARNRGLTPEVKTELEGVLRILREVAIMEKSSTQAESGILHLVVNLDRDRILSIAEKIEKGGIKSFLQEAHSRLLAGQTMPERGANPRLRHWLESCPFTVPSFRDWNPGTIATLIDWAAQARWRYSEQLESLLGLDHTQKPPWLNSLHKIARYHSSIKSMVKLAVKQPQIFAEIHIRDVEAPDQRPFSLYGEKTPLLTAVERLVKDDSEIAMEQLETRLGTQHVERALRKACPMRLTLHAEMQIVVFYEANPSLVPRMRFIGTSKKACFLCHDYLRPSPLRLQVSACHQKIYPTWMPPLYCPGLEQTDSHFTQFMKLSRKIEKLTRQDLRAGLTASWRPTNQDSTAGPSLTRTATIPTGMGSW